MQSFDRREYQKSEVDQLTFHFHSAEFPVMAPDYAFFAIQFYAIPAQLQKQKLIQGCLGLLGVAAETKWDFQIKFLL